MNALSGARSVVGGPVPTAGALGLPEQLRRDPDVVPDHSEPIDSIRSDSNDRPEEPSARERELYRRAFDIRERGDAQAARDLIDEIGVPDLRDAIRRSTLSPYVPRQQQEDLFEHGSGGGKRLIHDLEALDLSAPAPD